MKVLSFDIWSDCGHFLAFDHGISLFIVFHWFICLAPYCHLCCVLMNLWKTKMGEVIFLCLLLVIIVFIHLIIYFINFHQAMKISFVFSFHPFLFYSQVWSCVGGKNLEKTKIILLCKTLNLKSCHIMIVVIVECRV
jgi:hypothetical protein